MDQIVVPLMSDTVAAPNANGGKISTGPRANEKGESRPPRGTLKEIQHKALPATVDAEPYIDSFQDSIPAGLSPPGSLYQQLASDTIAGGSIQAEPVFGSAATHGLNSKNAQNPRDTLGFTLSYRGANLSQMEIAPDSVATLSTIGEAGIPPEVSGHQLDTTTAASNIADSTLLEKRAFYPVEGLYQPKSNSGSNKMPMDGSGAAPKSSQIQEPSSGEGEISGVRGTAFKVVPSDDSNGNRQSQNTGNAAMAGERGDYPGESQSTLYLKREIERQRLENELAQLRNDAAQPPDTYKENNLLRERVQLANERNRFYEEKIAYLEKRLKGQETQDIGRQMEDARPATEYKDMPPQTVAGMPQNPGEAERVVDSGDTLSALNVQGDSLDLALDATKQSPNERISPPATHKNELDELRAEVAELKIQLAGVSGDSVGHGQRFENRYLALQKSKVFFQVDSEEISAIGRNALDQVAAFFKAYPQIQILVIGYTDTNGSPEYNQLLSKRRAVAVAGYLEARGVSKQHVATTFHGEDMSVAGKDPAYGRRVEIVLEK